MKATFRALALCGLMTFATGTASAAVITMQAPSYIDEGGLVASVTGGWIKDVPEGQTATIFLYANRSWTPAIGFQICTSGPTSTVTIKSI